MDWTEPAQHIGVFVLGVLTCRTFTMWEGKRLKNQGAPVSEQKPVSSYSRRQTTAVFVVIVSLLVMALGFQQLSFQHRFSNAADCYETWGHDVTDALEKRSDTNNEQTTAERARADAVDNVFLLFIGFRNADPPLTPDQQRKQFNDSLDEFARAKKALVKADAANAKVKRANAFPQLNCQ